MVKDNGERLGKAKSIISLHLQTLTVGQAWCQVLSISVGPASQREQVSAQLLFIGGEPAIGKPGAQPKVMPFLTWSGFESRLV